MTPGETLARRLADTAILIVGAPRSGTTWLATIFDSHPDTLYRHEPDETDTEAQPLSEAILGWVVKTDARTAGKRPYFPKSWQSGPARALRTGLSYGVAVAERLGVRGLGIPDLGAIGSARVVIKSVRLHEGLGRFALDYPRAHVLLILRHPGGQAASLILGSRQGRFALAEPGTDMPFDEARAVAFAAARGVTEDAFQRLPDAAKYAWSWRQINDTAIDALGGAANTRIAVYEDLCADPLTQGRTMLAFCGLAWDAATERFITESTNFEGTPGYFSVMRNAIDAAERWRKILPSADQEAIRAVMAGSPLARYWRDLSA